MSLSTFIPANPPPPNRRRHQRCEPTELTYVDLGPDNGGLLLNISEGGLGFEGIVALRDGQVVPVEFKLPGTSITIRATCQFARKDNPGRGGGLKFVDLTAEARQQIREWIAAMGSQEDDSLRGGENGAVAEVVYAADPKAKSELPDSPAAPGERQPPQPPILSPEPNIVYVAPIPAPVLLALVTPCADASSALPNVPTAEDHSQRTPVQAAAPKRAAVEPKLPLQATPSGSDALRGPMSGVVVSARQPSLTPVLTYKTKPVANEKKTQAPTGERPSFGSQALQFAAGVAAGCLAMVAIAGALLWGGYFQLPSAVASRTSTEQNETGPNSPDFQVEIVNLNDRRWMLPMGVENSAPPSEQPAQPAQLAPVQSAAAAPPRAAEPSANAPAPRTRSASAPKPQIALQRPRATDATPRSASVQAPSLFDAAAPPLPSALPSLESSVAVALATVLPSPEPAAAPPALVAAPSSVPQPETNSAAEAKALAPQTPGDAKPAKQMSFRPAELALRVNPVYSLEARQQQAQGTVRVSVTIGKDGIPRSLKVVAGDPRLAGAATAAIARWRYKPAMLDGQPVESQLIITINFQL